MLLREKLHASIHLTQQVDDTTIHKNGHCACPPVKELGQLHTDVDDRAFGVFTVVFLERFIEVSCNTYVIHHVTTLFLPAGPIHARNGLQEIMGYNLTIKLLNGIERDGKGKMNVMYCLHACLDFAWRSNRIQMVPPFPKKKAYQIVESEIHWLPEERQRAVIEAIPEDHQPIFWWLKFHLRRPSEAMALQSEDFDGMSFTIRRSFSNKRLIERTKTGQIHHVPMVDEFRPYLERMRHRASPIFSPFFFVNPSSKMPGKHYTHHVLSDLWKDASKKVGESITLYAGLKHSSCSQLINEYGYSIHEVQMATDHARLDSVKKYAKVELSARKAILEKKIIRLPRDGTDLERKKWEKPQ